MTTTNIAIAHTHHQRLKTLVYSRKRHDARRRPFPVSVARRQVLGNARGKPSLFQCHLLFYNLRR